MVSTPGCFVSVQVSHGLHLSACLNTETYSDGSDASPLTVSFLLSTFVKGCASITSLSHRLSTLHSERIFAVLDDGKPGVTVSLTFNEQLKLNG